MRYPFRLLRRSRGKKPVRRSLWFAKSGTTAIEFGLLAPVFLLMLLGLVEFGRLLWTQSTLQEAVEAASRCASVTPTVCSTPSAIESYAASQAFGLPVSASAFTATSASCGYEVSASLPFDFVASSLFPQSMTVTAYSCYPSQSQS